MIKKIGISLFMLFWLSAVKAQLPDTLNLLEYSEGLPNNYRIIFEKKNNTQLIINEGVSQEVIFSEIKNGVNRFIVTDESKKYAVYFLKPLAKGRYLFMQSRFIDSLQRAKIHLPDEKLFTLALTREAIPGETSKPQLKSLSKKEVLEFLAYQHKSFEMLKQYCDFLILNSVFIKNFGTSKNIYDKLRETHQYNIYFRWLYAKGFTGGSFFDLVIQVIAGMEDKEVEAAATEYVKKEASFYN